MSSSPPTAQHLAQSKARELKQDLRQPRRVALVTSGHPEKDSKGRERELQEQVEVLSSDLQRRQVRSPPREAGATPQHIDKALNSPLAWQTRYVRREAEYKQRIAELEEQLDAVRRAGRRTRGCRGCGGVRPRAHDARCAQTRKGRPSDDEQDRRLTGLRRMHHEVLSNVDQVKSRTAKILQGAYGVDFAASRCSCRPQSKNRTCCARSAPVSSTCRRSWTRSGPRPTTGPPCGSKSRNGWRKTWTGLGRWRTGWSAPTGS